MTFTCPLVVEPPTSESLGLRPVVDLESGSEVGAWARPAKAADVAGLLAAVTKWPADRWLGVEIDPAWVDELAGLPLDHPGRPVVLAAPATRVDAAFAGVRALGVWANVGLTGLTLADVSERALELCRPDVAVIDGSVVGHYGPRTAAWVFAHLATVLTDTGALPVLDTGRVPAARNAAKQVAADAGIRIVL